MNRNQLLFLLVCIPVRIGLVVSSYFVGNSGMMGLIYAFAFLLLFVSVGFFRSTVYGKDVGFFGGKKYWFSSLHGDLFLVASVMMFVGIPQFAFIPLAVDVSWGFLHFCWWYGVGRNNKIELQKF